MQERQRVTGLLGYLTVHASVVGPSQVIDIMSEDMKNGAIFRLRTAFLGSKSRF
jgi:hypothetical protein